MTTGAVETDDSTAGIPDYRDLTTRDVRTDEDEQTFTFHGNVDDSDDDDGESVTFGFDNPRYRTGVSAGTDNNEATISITDDDVPDVTVMFDQSSYDAPEGGDLSASRSCSARRRSARSRSR